MLRRFAGPKTAPDEDYVEWVQRATHKAEETSRKAGVDCWLRMHLDANWSWGCKPANYSDERWSKRMTFWRDSEWSSYQEKVAAAYGVRPIRARAGHFKRWEDELRQFCVSKDMRVERVGKAGRRMECEQRGFHKVGMAVKYYCDRRAARRVECEQRELFRRGMRTKRVLDVLEFEQKSYSDMECEQSDLNAARRLGMRTKRVIQTCNANKEISTQLEVLYSALATRSPASISRTPVAHTWATPPIQDGPR